ncbi:MAG: hypothetical protein IKK57_13090 [Clostridia bacterium]|nr:hypothetical protein [Clostridia bacterium]
MKGLMRYLAAVLAVLCLMGAAVLAVFCCVTTERFALEVGETRMLRDLQQQRIDQAAAEMTERWQLSPELLTPWTQDAARLQSLAAVAWWGDIWSDAEADLAMPSWLTPQQEAELVAAIRADEGFIALTQETQRRAIARDEVAYAIDVAVCEAVTPLRRSVTEMLLTAAQEVVPLPMIRQAALIGAGVLTVLAVLLMLLAHRAAGSIFMAAGLMQAALSVPVILLDIPGMLAQLSNIAVLQGQNALACLGILWYGAAAAMLVLGLLIIGVKKAIGRDEE